MNRFDHDEGMTSRDHENQEYQGRDYILLAIALAVMAATLLLCILTFPWLGGWSGIIGF